MNSEQQEKAVIAAELAVAGNPAASELYVELGMAYCDASRFDEARSAFERALALNPNEVAAYNGIGRVHYHTGPPAAAIEAYRRAVALDRHYAPVYFGLGILYSTKVGDYEAALEAFRQGLELNPGNAFLRACLGSNYARMGRFDEAITTLQQAIGTDPESAFAYGWLSIVYLHQKRFEDMIKSCRAEIEIDDSHDARRLLGYVYDRLGRHDDAIHHLEQSITLEPEDYEARAALAKVYRTVGRLREADEQLAIASTMAEQDNEYGQACFEAVSGNVEQSLALLAIALAKGQLHKGWARIDPEFAFMNDDPRFQALIEDEK